MKTRQRVLLILLGIAIGYGIHDPAYDGSQWLLKSIHLVPNNPSADKVLGQSSDGSFITMVTYDGHKFTPRIIHLRSGNYIVVKNTSKKELMWLQSDIPGVATTRGYAEGEQIQFTSTDVGTYTISNKLLPSASFTLIVES
jgi:hypothetical protein